MTNELWMEENRDPSGARTGLLRTQHGEARTPAFMPVGTMGTVRTIEAGEVRSMGGEILLSNTYHLFLRPGHQLIESLGGLHEFMRWDGPILTDSGGFQVFSLSERRKISEEGVEFASPYDGTRHLLTPELAMEIQRSLGSDLCMILDECTPSDADESYARDSMERTLRWEERCRRVPMKPRQSVLGIVQGASFESLRRESARRTLELDFDAYAVGGLAVGEERSIRRQMLFASTEELPSQKLRYAMGIGRIQDIVDCVEAGCDLFDSVMPTRAARHGTLWTAEGKISIMNSCHREDSSPVEMGCDCPLCQKYSRAYLRHLFMAKEVLGMRLATLHNLRFLFKWLESLRTAIREGRFQSFADHWRAIEL